jgi:UDP-glucose 4-epimerase
VRVLVTGGAGFIGSHLCEALLDRGEQVHVLDDLSTGSMDNVRHLKRRSGFELTVESARNDDVVAAVVDNADVIYHLSAAVGVELVVESPVRALETNVQCTEVVLRHAAKEHTPVFVASTSEVYGKSGDVPFREDGDLVLGSTSIGRWSYACSKALDECLALAYWRERKLPTVVGRLFNTVGPRQSARHGMVLPRLTRQALAGDPLTVFGDGTQTRVFCHVRDVVRALIDLMGDPDFYGEVFNIGGTEEVSILDLAQRVRRAADSESEITLIPYEEAYGSGFEDMIRRLPSTKKIADATGWTAAISLDDIIRELVDEHQRVGAAA